jgi:pimeloyl-ACP methyl ester carboxylesterase
MLKKTLLSLAIAVSTAGLTACNLSSTTDNNDVSTNPVLSGQPGYELSSVTPLFRPTNPAGAQVPLNIDLLFAAAATSDGTASTADTLPPVTTAINDLAGFSTTSAMYMDFSGALDTESVKAGQTVYLIKLKNSISDSSIDALDISTILATGSFTADDQPIGGIDYEASYITLDDGRTHSIRILPTKPLDPKTKYVLAFTSGIKSASGQSAIASGDTLLIRSQQVIPDALLPVRSVVSLWDAAAKEIAGIDNSNLILSYAFTTGSGPDILKNYAAPSLFVADQLPLAKAEGLIENLAPGATASIAQGVAQGINALLGLNPGDAGYLDPNDANVIAAMKLTPQYSTAIYGQISAADLTALGVPSTINAVVDRPAPRQVDLIDKDSVDSALNNAGKPDGASPATFLGTGDSFTRYIQGQIQLPDFLGSATLTTEFTAAGIPAAMAADPAWTANTTLGAILDAALVQPAGSTPPKDTDGTTNVTYRYPFPQSVGTNYSPLMITMPAAVDYSAGGTNQAGSNCTTGYASGFPIVIYVHGITGARTNGLGYSAGLAANCIATVAIDLPLHGIAPITSNSDNEAIDNAVLPFTVQPSLASFTSSPYAGVAAAMTPTFDNLTEQHDSISQNGSGIRGAMDFDGTVDTDGTDGTPSSGTSGSTIINLFNFTRSRDNIQQAVVDLLNLNASLGNIDTALGGSKLDITKVFVAGHSLGAIFATTYAAVNNDPAVLTANTNLNKIQGVVLANGGSQLTKLLENSPSFGPTILGSLANAGITQGSSSLEKFLSVLQASIDGVDPAMTGSLLAETGTPIVLFNMVGGDLLPTDPTELAKVSAPTAFKVQGYFLPDQTVPNYDYFADAATNPYAAFASAIGLQEEAATARAPMVGTNGLATIMGLEAVNKDTDVATLSSPTQVVSRLSTGTHSTFANADAPAAFNEMLTQSITLIKGSFTVTNTTVLEASN